MAVMMTPRETWTDQRLDDLNGKVDMGFADVNARFDRFEKRVDARFEKVDKRLEQLDTRIELLADRFEALNRTLIGGFFVMIAALIGAIATQL